MPVKPPPITYRCAQCGWTKTVRPRSDALGPGDFFDSCPKCGSDDIQRSTGRDSLLSNIRVVLEDVFGTDSKKWNDATFDRLLLMVIFNLLSAFTELSVKKDEVARWCRKGADPVGGWWDRWCGSGVHPAFWLSVQVVAAGCGGCFGVVVLLRRRGVPVRWPLARCQ